jgi:GT2 family glycosyltransferase
MARTISIVIPTYRRERVLCDTLRALLAFDLSDCEIIVVDQTPEHEHGTREFLASIAGRITHLRLDQPNAPRARNVGVGAARGEIVLFLDDDVIPHPGLLDAHRRAYDDPTVAAVAGRVITIGIPLPATPSRKSRLPVLGWLFFNFAQTTPAEVATGRSCNMSVRRRALEEVGGFDERYAPTTHREETDVCFRLRQRGHRLVFEPRAVVDHLLCGTGGQRSSGRDPALNPSHHVNNFYFVWKNVPWHHRPLVVPVLVIQELRPGRAGLARRSWRDNLRILRLIAQGMWTGRRLARSGQ